MTLLSVDVAMLKFLCNLFLFFNSQGSTLFKPNLLAKENGGKVKDCCNENTNGVFVSADLGSGVSGPVIALPVCTQQRSRGKP